MSVLVAQADEQIDNIETTAGGVQNDMEQGLVLFAPSPNTATAADHSCIALQRQADRDSGCSCPPCAQDALDLLLAHSHPLRNHRYRRGGCCHPSRQQEVGFSCATRRRLWSHTMSAVCIYRTFTFIMFFVTDCT